MTDHIFKTSYVQLKQQLNICTIKTRNKGEEDGRNGGQKKRPVGRNKT